MSEYSTPADSGPVIPTLADLAYAEKIGTPGLRDAVIGQSGPEVVSEETEGETDAL